MKNNWTREEHILAFNLYSQIPFGTIHTRNPKIKELAGLLGRSVGAVSLAVLREADGFDCVTKVGRSRFEPQNVYYRTTAYYKYYHIKDPWRRVRPRRIRLSNAASCESTDFADARKTGR